MHYWGVHLSHQLQVEGWNSLISRCRQKCGGKHGWPQLKNPAFPRQEPRLLCGGMLGGLSAGIHENLTRNLAWEIFWQRQIILFSHQGIDLIKMIKPWGNMISVLLPLFFWHLKSSKSCKKANLSLDKIMTSLSRWIWIHVKWNSHQCLLHLLCIGGCF